VGQLEEPTAHELDSCPFCEGREARTPPESLALGRPPDAPADSPGWTVRVVPNLYPALARQEVVVHSPRHARSFAELKDREIELVAEAWLSRREAARADGFGYVHAMVNEGRSAGASLPHSHSQLAWLDESPPTIATETGDVRELLERTLEIDRSESLVLACHPVGRVPYEMLIAGEGGEPEFDLAAALSLLREGVRRLRAVEGAVAWNAWLHAGERWHLEAVPRLAVFAGLELGAGIFVNTLAPEEAAARLREAAG
jgi:UDPglucose--hexose-1-phosphate uridylyltransferase